MIIAEAKLYMRFIVGMGEGDEMTLGDQSPLLLLLIVCSNARQIGPDY